MASVQRPTTGMVSALGGPTGTGDGQVKRDVINPANLPKTETIKLNLEANPYDMAPPPPPGYYNFVLLPPAKEDAYYKDKNQNGNTFYVAELMVQIYSPDNPLTNGVQVGLKLSTQVNRGGNCTAAHFLLNCVGAQIPDEIAQENLIGAIAQVANSKKMAFSGKLDWRAWAIPEGGDAIKDGFMIYRTYDAFPEESPGTKANEGTELRSGKKCAWRAKAFIEPIGKPNQFPVQPAVAASPVGAPIAVAAPQQAQMGLFGQPAPVAPAPVAGGIPGFDMDMLMGGGKVG